MWQLAPGTKTAIDAHPSTAAAAVLVALGCLAAAVIVVLVADYVIYRRNNKRWNHHLQAERIDNERGGRYPSLDQTRKPSNNSIDCHEAVGDRAATVQVVTSDPVRSRRW